MSVESLLMDLDKAVERFAVERNGCWNKFTRSLFLPSAHTATSEWFNEHTARASVPNPQFHNSTSTCMRCVHLFIAWELSLLLIGFFNCFRYISLFRNWDERLDAHKTQLHVLQASMCVCVCLCNVRLSKWSIEITRRTFQLGDSSALILVISCQRTICCLPLISLELSKSWRNITTKDYSQRSKCSRFILIRRSECEMHAMPCDAIVVGTLYLSAQTAKQTEPNRKTFGVKTANWKNACVDNSFECTQNEILWRQEPRLTRAME